MHFGPYMRDSKLVTKFMSPLYLYADGRYDGIISTCNGLWCHPRENSGNLRREKTTSNKLCWSRLRQKQNCFYPSPDANSYFRSVFSDNFFLSGFFAIFFFCIRWLYIITSRTIILFYGVRGIMVFYRKSLKIKCYSHEHWLSDYVIVWSQIFSTIIKSNPL